MSLENGGKFDIPGDFDVDGGEHWAHRRGVDVDLAWVYAREGGDRVFPRDHDAVRISETTLKDELKLIDPNAWVMSHGQHFHLRFLPCPTG